MITIYRTIAYGLWAVLFVVWLLGYSNLKRNIQKPDIGKYLGTTGLLMVSFFLLFADHHPWVLGTVLISPVATLGIIGDGIALVGVFIACWARVTLGTNWSGSVATIKKDHELVTTGPYAFVRHPIYTGFLLAIVGTWLTIGDLGSGLAIVFAAIAFLIRIRIEEQAMGSKFGQQYQAYQQQTKTLVPWIW